MEKEKLESLLIDYIDGALNISDRMIVEQELLNNAESKKLYDQLREVIRLMDKAEVIVPGKKLRSAFGKSLQEEIGKQQPAKVVQLQPVIYRLAAGIVLVMAGVAIGFYINKSQQQEIAELKSQMEATKQMMLSMMDNQQSASQRLQGVNVALKIEKADDDVVKALAKTLNEDPNTNVRMAALDALSKFHTEPLVRRALINSLSRQKDPVVQIALIQLMVRMKEKGAIKELENIVDDNKTMNAVKDEAYSGILKLS